MNFQREEAVVTARESFAHPAKRAPFIASCRATSGPLPGVPFLTDQEQREQGEVILLALSEAMRSRQRDLMREAVRKAGCFLLSERNALADGEHEPLVVTQVACRVRWIELAPKFNWL
jgi:hypothetical protein